MRDFGYILTIRDELPAIEALTTVGVGHHFRWINPLYTLKNLQ
jgi:hypothetical protein